MAGIDPRRGPTAVEDLDYAISELGLRGVSLDPPDGADDARGRGYDDERTMYPLYQRAMELGVPVVLTLGPLLTPFSDPRAIEHVVADFPTLTVVCSHAGWPSPTEWIGLAYRYPNVIIEPSIYVYLPGAEPLWAAADSILRDQVVYASAFPFNGLDVVNRFKSLPLKPETLQAVLVDNASRILGNIGQGGDPVHHQSLTPAETS
jgi:predicted TIM-barrel fold metal-dependent hydrolase